MSSVTVAYHLTLCSNNIGTHNETMNSCLLLSFFFICTNLKRIPYINCIILTERVVNRTIHNWASEASPTLGCSIEISRDIYIYVTGSEKRYIVAHIFKIELLAPQGRVSSQL